MGLVARAVGLAAVLVTGAAAAGCGGSVADSDAPEPVRATPPPSSPFCTAAQANADAIQPLRGLVTGGRMPPDELADTAAAVRRAGAEMVFTAPEEIRPDVERTVQAVDLQLDVLLANGGDAAALDRDPALTARLRSPEFTGAAERVRAYIARTCGASRR